MLQMELCGRANIRSGIKALERIQYLLSIMKRKEIYVRRRHSSPAEHQRFPRVVRTADVARSDARQPLKTMRRNRSILNVY
jgi:hypothetical protein